MSVIQIVLALELLGVFSIVLVAMELTRRIAGLNPVPFFACVRGA